MSASTIEFYHNIFKFTIDFQVTSIEKKTKKTRNSFIAKGYVRDMHKFNAVAHYDSKTGKYIELTGVIDIFDRDWITSNSLNIIPKYETGVLTLRGLHYQLVGLGMINHDRLYKRTVAAMIEARRDGQVEYESFSDHDRAMIGETRYEETDLDEKVESAESTIEYIMKSYYKNRWENQDYYVEVFIEKKALQGVFQGVCKRNRVALGACKGYPSLTFLNDTAERFKEAYSVGKQLCILYFGDYDPSGEDIPRSIEDNLAKDFGVSVEVKVVALNHDQVIEWGLPPAPTKSTDSRAAGWDGIGQVELDAIDPDKLQEICQDAINSVFDEESHEDLMSVEETERTDYRQKIKDFVIGLAAED